MSDNLSKLDMELVRIGKFISSGWDRTNPDSVLAKLQECSSMLGSASWCEAKAKKELNDAQLKVARSHQDMSATMIKYAVGGACSDEQYNYDLATIQNKQLHYIIEALRSNLSYLKDEMRASVVNP